MRRLLEDSEGRLGIAAGMAMGAWGIVLCVEFDWNIYAVALGMTATAALSLIVYAYAVFRGLA